MPLDAIDFQILDTLQSDATTNNKEIARRVGLSPSATFERIRRLTRDKWIQRTVAVLDADRLGLDMVAFILVDVDYAESQDKLVAQFCALPPVLEVHTVTGEAFFLLKVRTVGRRQLNALINQIGVMSGVRGTKTMISIATFKEDTYVYLGDLWPKGGQTLPHELSEGDPS